VDDFAKGKLDFELKSAVRSRPILEPSVKHTSPETPVALIKAQTACAIAVILIPKVASQQRSGPLESSG